MPPPTPPRGPTPPGRGPTPPGRGPTPPSRPATPPRGPVTAKPAPKVTIPRPTPSRRSPAWLARCKRLILQPRQEWAAVAGEFTSAGPIYRRFLVPVAGVGPAAATVGTIISGGERSSLVGSFTISITDAITRGVLEYALNLVAVYLFAMVIDVLAGILGGQRNQVQALKVAAYGSTPYWLGGALAVLPKLAPIGLLLGLYSLRLYAAGLPPAMKAPSDKTLPFTLLTGAAGALIVLVVATLLQLFVSP